MDFCRTVELLYAALSVRPFRDWLIRIHMDRCPRCQERLLSREEARRLLVRPDQTGDAAALWRRISDEAGRLAPAPKAKGSGGRLAWQWAAASTMAAVIALTGFWLLRETGGPGFDARAVALQRSGQLGTFASSLGQEAVAVGVAAAMAEADVLVPSFREQGAQLWRGVTMVELFLYWGGDERGSDFAGPREDFPISVPVGSQASHAAGVAMAFQLRREPRVAVCVLGDGATSKGDVAEALLSITDERAKRATNNTAKAAYEKLRPTGKKHVEEAVPRLARMIEQHTK